MDAGQSHAGAEIREATPADAVAVAKVLFQAFVEYKSFYTPEAFAATAITADEIRQRISEGSMWIAVQNGEVIATIACVDRGADLYLRGMAVVPAARGAGVGRLLLEHAETFAVTKAYRRLVLSTTPFLTRAIQLYEHYGFIRLSNEDHDLFGTSLFTMAKVCPVGTRTQSVSSHGER